jgi:hypothetical protein
LSWPATRRKLLLLAAEAAYRWFAHGRVENAGELESELDSRLRLRHPISSGLTLGEFVDYYRFRSKVFPRTGYNLTFGLALEFSFLWKPVR